MNLEVQKQWYGHGVLMIFATLVGGLGYWIFLIGGFEIVPGYIFSIQLPGTAEGWRRTHTGPAMNGLMVIAVAAVLPSLSFSAKKAHWLGWLIVADGWANVIFYFFGTALSYRGTVDSVSIVVVVSIALCWLVAAVTAISGIKYLWDNRSFINTAK